MSQVRFKLSNTVKATLGRRSPESPAEGHECHADLTFFANAHDIAANLFVFDTVGRKVILQFDHHFLCQIKESLDKALTAHEQIRKITANEQAKV